MGLKDFFSNRTETSERHTSKELVTRYYKTTKQKAMQAIIELLKADPRVRVLDSNEEQGEISVEYLKPKKAFMVVSVITVFPFRTAIDLTLTTQTLLLPFDGGFSRREVLRLYKQLDKRLEYVGVGLSEGRAN